MTDLDIRTSDPELASDEPPVAHIVARSDDGTSADDAVLMARIEGTPLIALCGAVFVPHRDPTKLSPCQPCLDAMKEILEMRSSL